MVSTGEHRWVQVSTGGHRWIQVGTGGYRWAQVDTGGYRVLSVYTVTLLQSSVVSVSDTMRQQLTKIIATHVAATLC